MKHCRFILTDLVSNEEIKFRTLKEVAVQLDIPYHQARTILLADDKIYIHPKTDEMLKKYKIVKCERTPKT